MVISRTLSSTVDMSDSNEGAIDIAAGATRWSPSSHPQGLEVALRPFVSESRSVDASLGDRLNGVTRVHQETLITGE